MRAASSAGDESWLDACGAARDTMPPRGTIIAQPTSPTNAVDLQRARIGASNGEVRPELSTKTQNGSSRP
jgi:hypothetical protein